MVSQKKLKKINLILCILVAITILLTFLLKMILGAGHIIPDPNPKPPFEVSVDHPVIPEGQYTDYNGFPGKVPLKFTLTINPNKNITYLELKESAVIVDRENKNTLTKYATSINWEKTADKEHIFYRDSSNLWNSNSLKAEGWLWGCQNCFMGEYAPYIFTFNFIYAENSGTKQSYPITMKIPIV